MQVLRDVWLEKEVKPAYIATIAKLPYKEFQDDAAVLVYRKLETIDHIRIIMMLAETMTATDAHYMQTVYRFASHFAKRFDYHQLDVLAGEINLSQQTFLRQVWVQGLQDKSMHVNFQLVYFLAQVKQLGMAFTTAMENNPAVLDAIKTFNVKKLSEPSQRNDCSLAWQLFYATVQAYPTVGGKILHMICQCGRMLLHDDVLATIGDIGIESIAMNIVNVISRVTSPSFHPAAHQVSQLAKIN